MIVLIEFDLSRMKKYFLCRITLIGKQEYRPELTKLLQLKLMYSMLIFLKVFKSTFILQVSKARKQEDVVVNPP